MSLILDALRKIEQDKRRAAGGGASEVAAVSSSRFGGRTNWLALFAMAAASALVTAALVSFLNTRPAEVPPAETSAAVSVDEAREEPALDNDDAPRGPDTDSAPAEPTPAPVVTPLLAQSPRASAVPPPAPETDIDDADDADDAAVAASAELVAAESAPRAPAAPDDEPAGDPGDPAEPVDEADDVTQPIRLVGQERILLEALNVRQPSDPNGAPGSDEALPPEGFPELVLQGTSVIGGNAVAVISDQRVFEGDRIEGAVVVRIGEREVELEVDGKRFVLRL